MSTCLCDHLLPQNSAVLQQNARHTAASLLPALTHLPPTMAMPSQKAVVDSLPTEAEARAEMQS